MIGFRVWPLGWLFGGLEGLGIIQPFLGWLFLGGAYKASGLKGGGLGVWGFRLQGFRVCRGFGVLGALGCLRTYKFFSMIWDAF